MDALVLLLNIVGCSLAGVAYALWAVKWWRRSNTVMAALHALTAVVGVGFSVGYGLVLLEHPRQPIPSADEAFRPFIGLVLLFPALSRMLELREAEYREAFARKAQQALHSTGKGGP